LTSQTDKTQNISLIIGLSIPLAMILFIAVAINGPRWFNDIAPPRYDFLYSTGQQTASNTYLVKEDLLTLQEYTAADGAEQPARYLLHFFVHNVAENKSTEIQLEDALKLQLDASVRSPDGFLIEIGRRGGGWFIFNYRRNSNHRYMVKESYSEKLMLETHDGSYSYYWNFRFYGWLGANE
jgi:hypothetical protein